MISNRVDKWKLRNKIIKRLHKIRDDMDQSIRDIEWCNKNRTDADPIDIGFEKSIRYLVIWQIDAWEMDDMESVNRWQARINLLATGLSTQERQEKF